MDRVMPSKKKGLTRREFIAETAVGVAVASGALEMLKPLELLAAGEPELGIRAPGLGLDYIHDERKGVELHMLRFRPGASQARLDVHYSRDRASPLEVARAEGALAAINGTFYAAKGNHPLGCVAVNGEVKYEAEENNRMLNRTVMFVRKDGTVGFGDFHEKRELIDLTDPKADFSRLGLAGWEVEAIKRFREKHGFKSTRDLWHVGIPVESVRKTWGEVSVGPGTEIKTKKVGDILSENGDISDLLGGLGWLIRNGKAVAIEGDDKPGSVERHARIVQHFSKRSGVLGRAKRTVVATKGKDVYLITTDNGVSLDKLAGALVSYGMEEAVFFDGGESSEMVLHGGSGRHRVVNSGGEREMPTFIVLNPIK